MSKPSKWPPSIKSQHHNLSCSPYGLHALIMFPIRATCPAHNILLNFINRIIFGKQYSLRTNNYYNTLTIPWYQIPANQPSEWPLTAKTLHLRKQQPQLSAVQNITTHILNISLRLPCITISFWRSAVFQQFAPRQLYSLCNSPQPPYQRHRYSHILEVNSFFFPLLLLLL